MKTYPIIRNTIAGMALTGFACAASAAFLPFTVDESSVPGANTNIIEAGKLTGLYTEQITINADLSLDFIGIAEWQGYGDVNGLALPSQIGCFGTNCYNMYAIFEGTGTFNGGTGNFSIDAATFNLWIDLDQDTIITYNGGGGDGVTIAAGGSDYLIGFADSLALGVGIGGTPGAFQAIWDNFMLTDNAGDPLDGNRYFTAPRPFHMIVEATGDFDQDTFGPGTFSVTGDVSAAFLPVPEPATLALVGLGLLGLGAGSRFKAKSRA